MGLKYLMKNNSFIHRRILQGFALSLVACRISAFLTLSFRYKAVMQQSSGNSYTSKLADSNGIHYDMASNDEDLSQILSLQHDNLPQNISPQEAKSQGFVTIEHTLETLQALSDPYGHVVARVDDDSIVGYALIMLPHHRELVPFLRPILKEVEEVTLDGKPVREQAYCVMGQVCIAREFRGRGIFRGLYEEMVKTMKDAGYDYIVTGVALSNLRSRRAHEKIGFVPLGEECNEAHDRYQNIVLRLR
jgi:ribosomal protein S18 acetylase RimI-like enzyme